MNLDGVTVLDLSRLLPGPYATQILRDMGAEVIKIEDPSVGDQARYVDPYTDEGDSALFSSVNQGKKSVALDLKKDGGREAFLRLAEDSDVVFEQFRPGVAERLGVGYDDVRERNPDVVYCSLSGYGQSGPLRERVGHDLNYVGYAGLLYMNRRGPDDAPAVPGVPVADMAGGAFSALSILGALLQRELVGGGDYIDVSMTEAALSMGQAFTHHAFAGRDPEPGETPLNGGFPWYDVYETADGGHVTLAALEPKFWREFCRAVDREDLQDYHMSQDEEELRELRGELEKLFREKTREEWEDELGDKDVMFGPVKAPGEALEDSQVEERGIVVDEGFPRVGLPFLTGGGTDRGRSGEPPELGEHTEEVLRKQGYGDGELEELRDDGAI